MKFLAATILQVLLAVQVVSYPYKDSDFYKSKSSSSKGPSSMGKGMGMGNVGKGKGSKNDKAPVLKDTTFFVNLFEKVVTFEYTFLGESGSITWTDVEVDGNGTLSFSQCEPAPDDLMLPVMIDLDPVDVTAVLYCEEGEFEAQVIVESASFFWRLDPACPDTMSTTSAPDDISTTTPGGPVVRKLDEMQDHAQRRLTQEAGVAGGDISFRG